MIDKCDLIIIGGGPAGLTAAIYAIRKRLEVLLIAKDLGGKTNYRLQLPNLDRHLIVSGEEVISRFTSELEYLDFLRLMDKVERVEAIVGGYRVQTRGGKYRENPPSQYEAKAIIVTTGTEPQHLNVPGEKDFLMRGLCFSAISYAPLFIERTAIVIGDSSLALRGAMELALIAKRVTLVAPTPGELDTSLGKKLRSMSNVLILQEYQPVAVKGNQYAHSLLVKKEGDIQELVADGIFVELGLQPNSDIVAHLVELEADGRIKVDSHNRTSAPGIFAAGDVTNVYAEQVLIAIGEGAKAALAAHEYLLNLTPDS
jgi:alkyl hydroperoxide reductase subunit F